MFPLISWLWLVELLASGILPLVNWHCYLMVKAGRRVFNATLTGNGKDEIEVSVSLAVSPVAILLPLLSSPLPHPFWFPYSSLTPQQNKSVSDLYGQHVDL